MKKIVLASASPRRRELLSQVGVTFEVMPADGEERITSTEPSKVVEELSYQKAMFTAKALEKQNGHVPEGFAVIGADTIVSYEGRILGKPSGKEDAVQMLRMLQGNTHQVYTGVAMLVYGEDGEAKEICHAERTEVFVHEMSDDEIRNYIASGEPMDKAGAYGIQGKAAAFIEKIEGDYNNVVGLPIARIYQELKQLGIDVYKFS